jgi:hypothetical protein
MHEQHEQLHRHAVAKQHCYACGRLRPRYGLVPGHPVCAETGHAIENSYAAECHGEKCAWFLAIAPVNKGI